MRLPISLAVFLVTSGISPAFAMQPPGGLEGPAHRKGFEAPHEMRAAKNVERLPGSSLNMRIGEKRSFKVQGPVACSNSKVLKCQVKDNVLTVFARGAGRAVMMPVGPPGSKGPPPFIQCSVQQ